MRGLFTWEAALGIVVGVGLAVLARVYFGNALFGLGPALLIAMFMYDRHNRKP